MYEPREEHSLVTPLGNRFFLLLLVRFVLLVHRLQQLTPMEMMKLRMRKALDSQLQKDKSAIAKKSSKDNKMAELDRK